MADDKYVTREEYDNLKDFVLEMKDFVIKMKEILDEANLKVPARFDDLYLDEDFGIDEEQDEDKSLEENSADTEDSEEENGGTGFGE